MHTNSKTRIKSVWISDYQTYKDLYRQKTYPEEELVRVPYQQNFPERVIDLVDKKENQLPLKQKFIFVYMSNILNLSNDINVKQAHPQKIKNSHKQKFYKVFYFSIFQSLARITIKQTYLDSCEFLSFLNAPTLQSLDISSNLFASYKPLVRMNVQSLNSLGIKGNPGLAFDFSRLKLPSTIQRLDYEPLKAGKIKNQDLSNLAKLQPHLCYILELDIKRIPQKKFIKKMQAKFTKNGQSLVVYEKDGKKFV